MVYLHIKTLYNKLFEIVYKKIIFNKYTEDILFEHI